LIHEYSVFLSFFSLALILLFASSAISTNREVLLMIGSNQQSSEQFNQLINRSNTWNKLVLFFIVVLFFFRLNYLFFTPNELMVLSNISNETILFLVSSFLFLNFWVIIVFFLRINIDIRNEVKNGYLKKIYTAIAITFFFDIFLNGYFYIISFLNLLKPARIEKKNEIFVSKINQELIILIIFVLLALLVFLFVLFSLKRSLKIVRQYWIIYLLLYIVLFLYWFNFSSVQLGWYEFISLKIKLFSWHYGYAGLILLLFLSISLSTNICAIILLSLKDSLVNPQKYKQVIISFIKIGFVSILIFCGMVLLPEILMWLY